MFGLIYRLAKPLKMLAALTLSVGGLAVLALYRFQTLLIYPASLNDGHGHCSTPDEYGMQYEAHFLETDDGERLQCYVLKHDRTAANYANKTVLVLSPNAGNIGHAMPIVGIIHQRLGYNVVIYSYRGYGKSTGTPSEAGLKVDARRIMRYIHDEDAQLAESSLILYGRSLGGAVAAYIAATEPGRVLALILENTFLLIPKTVPHIFPFLKYLTGFVHEIWDSETLIPRISLDIPVLLFSARKDEIVPPAHMDRIFQLLRSSNKTMWKYEESSHNDTVAQSQYWERVDDFIKSKVNPVGW